MTSLKMIFILYSYLLYLALQYFDIFKDEENDSLAAYILSYLSVNYIYWTLEVVIIITLRLVNLGNCHYMVALL